MGSHVFTWDHPATEVFVTGTFDDWSKTVKLEKKEGNLHEKKVSLANADEKILYKFVVDGNWTTDHTAPIETDESGNTNNVLEAKDIVKTTSDLPGAFPETPAAGAEEVKVNPLPATAGVGNPITTRPGEGVPALSSVTSNTVQSGVTLDKESYEKSGSTPGAPQLPNPITPETERAGAGLFGLPEQSKNTIPESSLPIAGGAGLNTIQSSGPESTTAQLAGEVPKEPRGQATTMNDSQSPPPGGPNIQSVGAGSTTAALAGQVPKEPRGVPEVVEDSQNKANVSPEASANPEAVQEKAAVESELEKKVPEQPAASESTISGKAAGIAAGAAAGVTAAAAGAASYVSSGKAKEDAVASVPETVKDKLPESVKDTSASNGSTTGPTPIASAVPDPVQESIAKANQSPEAATSASAVQEKSAVESELLKKIPTEQATGEPAPEVTETAATSAVAPKATLKSTEQPLSDTKAENSKSTAAPISGIDNSKSTTAPASESKTTTETEKSKAAAPSTPSKPAGGAMATAISESKRDPESRDISPMTRPDGTRVGGPSVTTGVGKSSTPQKSTAAGSSSAAASPASTEGTDKKSKRKSGFFDKIKSIAHRHKKDEK